jgi:hypothetical protein
MLPGRDRLRHLEGVVVDAMEMFDHYYGVVPGRHWVAGVNQYGLIADGQIDRRGLGGS